MYAEEPFEFNGVTRISSVPVMPQDIPTSTGFATDDDDTGVDPIDNGIILVGDQPIIATGEDEIRNPPSDENSDEDAEENNNDENNDNQDQTATDNRVGPSAGGGSTGFSTGSSGVGATCSLMAGSNSTQSTASLFHYRPVKLGAGIEMRG
jgi:hypothetical protein